MASFCWKIKELRKTSDYERFPSAHYRWHVIGEIIDGMREPVPFCWSVPSLSNPTYDLSNVEIGKELIVEAVQSAKQ
jgi:hypothetical protein